MVTDTAHYAKVRAALGSEERLREARVMLVDGEEQGADQGVVTLAGVCSRGQGGGIVPLRHVARLPPAAALQLRHHRETQGRDYTHRSFYNYWMKVKAKG